MNSYKIVTEKEYNSEILCKPCNRLRFQSLHPSLHKNKQKWQNFTRLCALLSSYHCVYLPEEGVMCSKCYREREFVNF
jgi:hypothetical protein